VAFPRDPVDDDSKIARLLGSKAKTGYEELDSVLKFMAHLIDEDKADDPAEVFEIAKQAGAPEAANLGLEPMGRVFTGWWLQLRREHEAENDG
jgi:hypothetical protein